MTFLIREDLQPLIKQALKNDYPKESLNAGLLIQRGLTAWAEDDKEKKIKKALIDTITSIKPSQLYQLAFDRWLLQTQQKDNFVVIPATVDGRLMTGLALGGTLETGVTTQHSYGMPMLAGSSVKGAVRAYAEAIGLNPNVLSVLFGHGEDDPKYDENDKKIEDTAGYLIWHDAWFIPFSKENPFVGEIVTVHHQKYYAGQLDEALDMESPVPNQQLAVQGSFYFVIEGANQLWLAFAKQLLENMLTEFGLGAKGATGYGYFQTFLSDNSKELNSKLQKHIKQLKERISEAEQIKALEKELTQLTENQQLIKKFEANLPNQALWKDKPNFDLTVEVDGKKYKFIDIYQIVQSWSDSEDISYALDFFERNLKIWTGKPLGKNPKWKERLNSLKDKIK